MRGANDNCRRRRYVITVDRWDEGGDLDGVHLVTIYRGEAKGEPEYSELIGDGEGAIAYAQSMARHLRCPVHYHAGQAS